MAKVAPPISVTVIRNAALRPTRSPRPPKISAPIGRKKNPAPNRASAAKRPAVASRPAKKFLPMIEVSAPKTKKSYHSTAVPADEAVMTVRMEAPPALGARPPTVASAMHISPLGDDLALVRADGLCDLLQPRISRATA